ncbi:MULTISPECIES: SDR family NAD(P)-dependent oxidoreductase [unclassified Bacillus (in: firmicutes)]|uniref:SDR family NAD(P)-dependent oxidoreductase n=1 Tax=unclassified Bacillus (in: firmicutes) TaxID=185979 RepID=UPI0008F28815|nr:MULTISPECIES: SDR family NAD(P)-dependent oxidoreductase [unclassified Bacillus (in: firmicutes)]SFB16891.1 UDP-glucuronate 4-epimerase [Bacillus sp. UNCCL13]SFQ77786.1 UDP-glucuronate 4-epimerase [Bacillus sp. cl95]
MRIIVTGGAGFIGSNLSKRLLAEGHKILVLDAMHPYYSIERKEKQLKRIGEAEKFLFYKKNLLDDEAEIKEIFSTFQADCVIHLAAIPGVSLSIEVPNEYVDYDIKATINALRYAGETGVKHFIFASSSSVYGEQENVPLKEEMATGKVISPYAAAKYGAESFCHAYSSIYGMKMTILRFFTVYGPGGRPDMAITKFIRKLQSDESIEIFGNGTSRDYTYIDDCVEGIILAMQKSKGNQTYNLGSGRPIAIEELVQSLRTHFPSMKLTQDGTRLGDVSSTWADISKANSELGYEPAFTFAEGLARTVEWSKENES